MVSGYCEEENFFWEDGENIPPFVFHPFHDDFQQLRALSVRMLTLTYRVHQVLTLNLFRVGLPLSLSLI